MWCGREREPGMAADDQDRLRTRIAWVVTGIWVLCFPLVLVFPALPIAYAQPPMMLAAGWLFAAPLMRRNGGEQ